MKRRDFFKVITGFVAGVFAAFVPKAKGSKRSGARLATKKEFQDILTEVVKRKMPFQYSMEHQNFDEAENKMNPWDNLGCKDCFRGCGQWDICMATLRKRIESKSFGADIFDPLIKRTKELLRERHIDY